MTEKIVISIKKLTLLESSHLLESILFFLYLRTKVFQKITTARLLGMNEGTGETETLVTTHEMMFHAKYTPL